MHNQAETNTIVCANSLEGTMALGELIGRSVSPGGMVGLSGDLGAGKTELVRGIARGLGVQEEVVSPSFVLEAIYDTAPLTETTSSVEKLHHWDLYRIRSGELECELLEYLGDPSKVTVVEWPERVGTISDILSTKLLISFRDLGTVQSGSKNTVFLDDGKRAIEVVYTQDPQLLVGLARGKELGLKDCSWNDV